MNLQRVVKRYGNLFQGVCFFESLVNAAREAAKGKKTKSSVTDFLFNLENEAIALERELQTKTYVPRPYKTFMVHDPKERMICAADFRDRVVHHSACRVLEPIFEKAYVFDSYACRKKKGTHLALQRARSYSRRYAYFLKLDVRKFFDSVDHGVLMKLIRRKIKDKDLLWLLDLFIRHPVPWTEAGKGIPIGNLTSQHFANFYLTGLDYFIKSCLRIGGYVRYMDDFLVFADEKGTLWDAAARIKEYLWVKRLLKIKKGSLILAPVEQGIPFLGFRVFPGIIRISRPGWRRFRRRTLSLNEELRRGKIDQYQWRRGMAGLVGHLGQIPSRNLRHSFFQGPGALEYSRQVKRVEKELTAH